jgi:hypothetical protein
VTEPQDDSEILNSRTGAGLMKFFEVKARKHELSESVAGALRTGSKRVLDVEDDSDSVDLTAVDVDELVRRFRKKNRASLTDQSLQAYESRFRRSLTMYIKWLDGESDWAGKSRTSSSGNGGKSTSNSQRGIRKDASSIKSPVTSTRDDVGNPNESGSTRSSKLALFDYPVLLQDSGATAILRLPATYSTRDADRMASLISALAVKAEANPSSPSADA